MKYIIISIILLINFQSISQTEKSMKCLESISKATIDFQNNNRIGNYNFMEIEFSSDGDFEKFYQVYMYSKYSIFMEIDFSTYDECYSSKMDSLIRSNYGSDIYKKTRKNAFDFFKNSTRKKQSEILDLSKYYLITESEPKFIGNDYQLSEFLKKYFVYKDEQDEEFKYRSITLFIDKEGSIQDIESTTDALKEGISKKEVVSQLKSLGNFVPAYLFDVPVNSKMYIALWW